MAKHRPRVEDRRHAMLDAYEADGRRRPAGARRGRWSARWPPSWPTSDGGPEYLQIVADLVNRPRPIIDPADFDDPASSVFRWRQLVGQLLEGDVTRLHRRFVARAVRHIELARRARSGPHTDDRLFVSQLVDLVTGILAAPLSDETCASTPSGRGRRGRGPS